jgi:alkaline phosphatase D
MTAPFSFYDKKRRPWPNERLDRAAIVGHTTDTSARLWVRVKDEGAFQLLLSTDPWAGRGAPAPFNTLAQAHAHHFTNHTDRTHVFDLTGLSPGTRYHYAVCATAPDGARSYELGHEEPFSFQTMPADAERVVFGAFSCHNPYDKTGRAVIQMHMWHHLRQQLEDHRAAFVIGLGDQVYADGADELDIWHMLKKYKDDKHFPEEAAAQKELMRSWYRDIYRGYWGHNDLLRVFQRFPTYLTWDDHEIMDGWGSHSAEELDRLLRRFWVWDNDAETARQRALIGRMFEVAAEVYDEYQHSHNPPTPPGVRDYHFQQGPCGFYVVDTRGHRAYDHADSDGEAPILGAAQWARLEAWLDEGADAAQVAFLVTPVPVVHVRDWVLNHLDVAELLSLADDLRDAWCHRSRWAERDRLLDAAFAWSHDHQKPVVFLSGDVHAGASFRLRHPQYPKARVWQLTTSPITRARELHAGLARLVTRAEGALGYPDETPPQDRVTFERLGPVCGENNFALIEVTLAASGACAITWRAYQDAGRAHQIAALEPLPLT